MRLVFIWSTAAPAVWQFQLTLARFAGLLGKAAAGEGRARHSVRAAVVNQNALLGKGGGQRTARPTCAAVSISR